MRVALWRWLAVGAALAVAVVARAAGPDNCVQFLLTGASELTAVDVSQFSAPWTLYNSALGCNGVGTATVKVYGPCLDNASPCHRGLTIGPIVAPTPTLNGTTLTRTGAGPIEAVAVVPSAIPTGTACIGGTNDAATCTADSACPSGRCGPCRAVVAFCGMNPSGGGAREP